MHSDIFDISLLMFLKLHSIKLLASFLMLSNKISASVKVKNYLEPFRASNDESEREFSERVLRIYNPDEFLWKKYEV